MRPPKSLIALAVMCALAACAAPNTTPTYTITPLPTSTATPTPTSIPDTPTPSTMPTFAPSPTYYPTATYSPALSTAAANGECIRSFDSFAYHGPEDRSDHWIPPLAPWQIEATIPTHKIDEYNASVWALDAAITRSVKGRQEVWLTGPLYPSVQPGRDTTILYIYQPETGQWEIIPGDIGDTGLYVQELFVTQDGAVWGRIVWEPVRGHPTLNSIPVLSKFNEDTRRFELAKGTLEIPLVTGEQFFGWPRIVLDKQDTFWLFADDDGIYRYDLAAQTTDKQADTPDFEVTGTALAPDGSIYIHKHSDRMYSGETFLRTVPGTLFRFVPETREIVPVDLPDQEWPGFAGLMTDHSGNLWLGSMGYRTPDGDWHLIHPHIDRLLELIDAGGYSYVWATPWPMLESSDGILWYQKSLDTGGWVDGAAWYDPKTGEGCQFTNIPADIIEDSAHRLWLAADGKLYQYLLQ